ncbi:Uncharacterised protein [Mycobacteroides abscessus subsp. massiliense]|nr:Uncharacterised protein [Mycobacteroides abscessus subsp. massiliense]SLJ49968.1 Uncharacterised protein [Mycobacteroides abscessus subsp. abscessus]
MSTRALTDNQIEVLLQFGRESGWLRPLDLGGRDGSNHSAILAQLVRRGLVESKVRSYGDRGRSFTGSHRLADPHSISCGLFARGRGVR